MKKTYTRIKRNWFWWIVRLVLFLPAAALVCLGAVVALIYEWIDKILPAKETKEEIPLNKMTERELKRYHSLKATYRNKSKPPIYTIDKEYLPSGHIKYVFKRLEDS
jgi:hypothetical protein